MGVLKARVDGIWVPVSQGFSLAQVGYVGLGVQGAAQPAIGTEADVTGMTVTWNADPTHRYKTTASVVLRQSGVAGEQYLHVTNAANAHLKSSAFVAGGAGVATHHVELVETGLSGSQTRKGRVAVTPGTAATNVNEYVGYLLVEDITTVTPDPTSLYPQVLYGTSAGGTTVGNTTILSYTTPIIPVGRLMQVTWSVHLRQTTAAAFDMEMKAPGQSVLHQFSAGLNSQGQVVSLTRPWVADGTAMNFNITVSPWGGQQVIYSNISNITIVVV